MKFADLRTHFQHMPFFTLHALQLYSPSLQTLRNQLSRWAKQGQIIHLRRSMYTLAEVHRKTAIPTVVIATHMVTPSYISLEWALSHYGLIPEQAVQLTAVTTQKTQHYVTPIGTFSYRHIKVSRFLGFVERQSPDGFTYYIATPEKAILDFLYYRLSEIRLDKTDIFETSYRFQNLDSLNWAYLLELADTLGSKKLRAVATQLYAWQNQSPKDAFV